MAGRTKRSPWTQADEDRLRSRLQAIRARAERASLKKHGVPAGALPGHYNRMRAAAMAQQLGARVLADALALAPIKHGRRAGGRRRAAERRDEGAALLERIGTLKERSNGLSDEPLSDRAAVRLMLQRDGQPTNDTTIGNVIARLGRARKRREKNRR